MSEMTPEQKQRIQDAEERAYDAQMTVYDAQRALQSAMEDRSYVIMNVHKELEANA